MDYQKLGGLGGGWNKCVDHATITHQDDMTEVDLPHFVVTTTGDITQWRFGVNAHVISVTDDCTIFSTEQGAGAKNTSSIIEQIILDHILR